VTTPRYRGPKSRPLSENVHTHGWKPQLPWREATDEDQDRALDILQKAKRTSTSKSRQLVLAQQLASTLQQASSTKTPIDGSLKPFYEQKIRDITLYPKFKRYLSKLLSNVTFV
jgi:hypothetical protein